MLQGAEHPQSTHCPKETRHYILGKHTGPTAPGSQIIHRAPPAKPHPTSQAAPGTAPSHPTAQSLNPFSLPVMLQGITDPTLHFQVCGILSHRSQAPELPFPAFPCKRIPWPRAQPELCRAALSPGQKPEQPRGPPAAAAPAGTHRAPAGTGWPSRAPLPAFPSCWEGSARAQAGLCPHGRAQTPLVAVPQPRAQFGTGTQNPQPQGSSSGGWAGSGEGRAPQGLSPCLPALEQAGLWAPEHPHVPLPQLPSLADWILHRSCCRSHNVLEPFFGVS